MTRQLIPSSKIPEIILATMVAAGSTIIMASAATAVTLKVSVENRSPPNGNVLTPFWVGFHDGSFDLYDLGSPASPAIKALAWGGITGFESTIPGLVEGFRNSGFPDFDGTIPSIPQDSTLSSVFARSSAAVNSGVQSLVFTDNPFGLGTTGVSGIFWPGYIATRTIKLNGSFASHRYFSYAANLYPTNDAFIANDDPIEIFDAEGNFIGVDFIVYGNQVLDAGTEVNDENPLVGASLFHTGIPENGVIHIHQGVKPPGSEGVLDFEVQGKKVYAKADFKTPGYQVARITVTQVPEPASTIGLLALGGLFVLRRQVRQRV